MKSDLIEKAYWANQVADSLNISTSTLRKYCLILEEAGYKFLRGDNQRRAFTQKDIRTLRMFQEIAQNKNTTLEDAAKHVLKQSITHADIKSVMNKINSDENYVMLQNVTDQLLEQNKLLHQQLEMIMKEVAITKEKMEEFITETRTEREKKKKKNVWKWFTG